MKDLAVTWGAWVLASVAGLAQMTGTYTVDNGRPAGGTNFTRLGDAAKALAVQGVSGPVTIYVHATDTPYAGMWIVPIPGASTTNRVRFVGVGMPKIAAPIPTSTTGNGINLGAFPLPTGQALSTFFNTGPRHVVIDGFEIAMGTQGTGIYGGGCDDITIRNCRVHGCGEGIYLAVTTRALVEDNEIYDLVPAPPLSLTFFPAAILVAAHSHDGVVRRNRVHDCASRGILIGGPENTNPFVNAPSQRIVCVNNTVWNVDGLPANAQTFGGGIVVQGAPNAVVANNSVSMPPFPVPGLQFLAPGIHLMGTLLPTAVSNNIVAHQGPGACIGYSRIDAGCPGLPSLLGALDFNLYDPGATGVVAKIVTGAPSACFPMADLTLPEWRGVTGREASTTAGAAGFVSTTDLHLAPTSSAVGSGVSVPLVPRDREGEPRAAAPCRGSDEFGGPVPRTAVVGAGATPDLRLVADVVPFLGNTAFRVDVESSMPSSGTTATLFAAAGPSTGAAPLGNGGTLYLDPAGLSVFLSVGLGPFGPKFVGSHGGATFFVPIPASPALTGVTFGLQALVDDGGGPSGGRVTNALDVTLY